MPRVSITLVYSVEAESKYLARIRIGEALRLGVANGVTLEFESVQLDPTSDLVEGDPSSLRLWWKAWAEEFRDQLLGPRKRTQQPARKQS